MTQQQRQLPARRSAPPPAQQPQRAQPQHVATAGRSISEKLVGRLAAKFGIAAEALLTTLRDTVFRVRRDESPFTDTELAAALTIAERYDLDPFAKQIYAARHKGALLLIVPIDGWIRIMNRDQDYDGCDFSYEMDDSGNPISCTCSMHSKSRSHPTVVTEYYDECYMDSSDVWRKWPKRFLRHRAFIQCARIHRGISGIVDEDEAQGMDVRVPEYEVVEPQETARRGRLARSLPPPDPAPTADERLQDPAPEPEPLPVEEPRPAPPPRAAAAPPQDPRAKALWDEWLGLRGELSATDFQLIRKETSLGAFHPGMAIEELERLVALAGEIVRGQRE